MAERFIRLHPQAPQKPALTQPCNGCGVCCAAEPCPLGVVLSLRRSGACRMLHWDAQAMRYTCGALGSPGGGGGWWQRWRVRLVRRWIAAGVGCDCDWEVAVASSTASHTIATHHDSATR